MCSSSGEIPAAGASAGGRVGVLGEWQGQGQARVLPLEVGVGLREAAGRLLALKLDLVIMR